MTEEDTEPKRDRPENQSGVPQIEVTPEMASVGASVLAVCLPDVVFVKGDDERLAKRIFQEMLVVAIGERDKF